jgi:putative heme iron utilization protein
MTLATEARQFLRSTQHGILSTHSIKFAGYPFGSVTPFILGHDGHPIILISTIAEHTKNIIANPKVSLLVFAKGDDLQANARLTLIGEAESIGKDDTNLMARYSRYFPESVGYFAMHDFSFYRININQARYIAGFGKMGWVAGSDMNIQPETTNIAALEADMVNHMNQDHADSLVQYCQHFHNITPERALLIGIDSDGFDVEAVLSNHDKVDDIKMLRFSFESPIFDTSSARAAFVAMSKQVRA